METKIIIGISCLFLWVCSFCELTGQTPITNSENEVTRIIVPEGAALKSLKGEVEELKKNFTWLSNQITKNQELIVETKKQIPKNE